MEEEWRDIKGFPGYQISNLGRVRTHNKITVSKRFPCRKWKDRILKTKLNAKDGYRRIELWGENGTHRTVLVHRLVADAFLTTKSSGEDDTTRNTANMLTVNHINRNRQDNRVENLEWLTLADNTRAAFAMGCGTEKPCKLKTCDGKILTFKSLSETTRFLGRRHGYISHILRSNREKARDINGTIYYIIKERA